MASSSKRFCRKRAPYSHLLSVEPSHANSVHLVKQIPSSNLTSRLGVPAVDYLQFIQWQVPEFTVSIAQGQSSIRSRRPSPPVHSAMGHSACQSSMVPLARGFEFLPSLTLVTKNAGTSLTLVTKECRHLSYLGYEECRHLSSSIFICFEGQSCWQGYLYHCSCPAVPCDNGRGQYRAGSATCLFHCACPTMQSE
jgi:hypothetical protein